MTRDAQGRVLHTVRCLGFTTVERVAEAAGTDADTAEGELLELAIAGLVTRDPGPFGGWGLTEAGRAEDAARVGAELDAAGTRDALTEAYRRFLVLNPELLDLCTAWQLRPVGGVTVANDHRDTRYDARVLAELDGFDLRAGVVLAELAGALGRFGRYRERFSRALELARAGKLEYVADDTASYHGVWFQLHEDLLVTLGIPRW